MGKSRNFTVITFLLYILLSLSECHLSAEHINSTINPEKDYNLVELIDIALHNNPSTREAWANVRAQEAIKKQAESQWYPQIAVGGQISREKKIASQKLNKLDELQYGPTLQITYLLLDFGGRKAEVEEAYQSLLAADFQFNQSIQNLLLAVAQAYYSLYSAHANLEAKEIDLKDAETALTAAQEQFQSGLAAKPDLLKAQANYQDALYTLTEAQGQVKDSHADLSQALGLPADTKIKIASPKKEIPTNITEKDVSELIKQALAQRPDIAALRATLKAKEAAITAANSDMLPSLNAAGAADKNWYELYDSTNTHETDHSYSGSLKVNWDIFDGFYNYNRKKQAEAEADAAREELKQLELSASSDVWTSYYDFQTAVSKYKYGQAYFDSAVSSYNLELESYEAGLKSILDLLDAQSDLSTARSQLIQTKKDLFVSLATLAHATGSLYAKPTSFTSEKEKEKIRYKVPTQNFTVRKK